MTNEQNSQAEIAAIQKKFLRTLFEGCQGYIEIRAIREDPETKKKIIRRNFYKIEEIDRIVSDLYTQEMFQGFNLYYGVCPRIKIQGKLLGDEDHVKQINCLWADLDTLSLDVLNAFPLKPSIIIFSGHGYHLYWLLDHPYWISDQKEFLKFKGYNKGLAEALKGDSTHDLARVLRIPGTMNLKDPANPIEVKLITENGRRYTPEEFKEYFVKVDDVKLAAVDMAPADIPDRFWQMLQEDEMLEASYKGERQDLKDKSRSGQDMALANKLLVEYNFKDNEAIAILRATPYNKGKTFTKGYFQTTIGKVKKQKEEVNMPFEEGGDEEQDKKKFKPRIYANAIKKIFSLKWHKSKNFYYYNKKEGIWEVDAEKFLANWIEMKLPLPVQWKKRYYIQEIIASLERMKTIMKMPPEPPRNLIAFQNCIVDIETGKEYEFNSDYFFLQKLAVPFVRKEKMPMIDKFLNEIVAEEDMISLVELHGYCMLRKYPYQVGFFLYGGGANGKTQYCELGARIIGRQNISAVRLGALTWDKFQAARLYGKLMNLSPEIDLQIFTKTGVFKQLTGGDPVQFERKYKDAFEGKNYAKLVFLCNHLPYTLDQSPAFFRRTFVIEFTGIFRREDKGTISDIAEKFPQEEVNSYGYACFLTLQNLAKRDFKFSRHKTIEEKTKKYEEISDPLEAFLKQKTKQDYEEQIVQPEFNKRFNRYLEDKGVKRLWTSQKITKIMKAKGYVPQKSKIGIDQTGMTYGGIAWIEDLELEDSVE